MTFDRAVWGIWWIGTILVVLSWFDIVSTTLGWTGFAAALASSVVSIIVNKYWRPPE